MYNLSMLFLGIFKDDLVLHDEQFGIKELCLGVHTGKCLRRLVVFTRIAGTS